MKLKITALLGLALLAGTLSAQSMFGAFKIVTSPKGAAISLYGTNQSLGTTPSQIFPIFQDEYAEYNNGIAGRTFDILIARDGYKTLRRQIFVPYNQWYQEDAIDNPTVFRFDLRRQYGSSYNYSYVVPPPRPPSPWLFWGNLFDGPRHHWNGHHNHILPPPPLPGGGHGGQNPPPPPPGGGDGHGSHGGQGHGSGNGGGNDNGGQNPPLPPPGGSGHGGSGH